MTDLERMAGEAGVSLIILLGEPPIPHYQVSPEQLKRLSALIRADEREKCARVAAELWQVDGRFTALEFAAAIRAGSGDSVSPVAGSE